MSTDNTVNKPGGRLLPQALAHGAVFTLLVSVLIWLQGQEVSGLAGPVKYLAAAWAFLSGMALSHIVHEWGHFVGAVITGSRLTIKPKIFPLFFDFDYVSNSSRQFLCMSLGGLVGNFVLLIFLALWVVPQTLVLTSVLAAVLGQLVYVLILELPISLGILAGREPLATLTEHFGQGGPLFLRATIAGVGAAALIFLVY
jgi:hypothetical protein